MKKRGLKMPRLENGTGIPNILAAIEGISIYLKSDITYVSSSLSIVLLLLSIGKPFL